MSHMVSRAGVGGKQDFDIKFDEVSFPQFISWVLVKMYVGSPDS